MIREYYPALIALSIVLFSPFMAEAQRGRGGDRFGPGPANGQQIEPKDLDFKDGVAEIKDRETFNKLSYQGLEVMIDTNLKGLQYVKYQIDGAGQDDARFYFINTKTHRGHPMFMRKIGIGRGRRQMRGVLVYRPLTKSPNGEPGVYTFEYEPNDRYPYENVKYSYDMMIEKMPILKGRLVYSPQPRAIALYEREKEKYANGKLPVYLARDLDGRISYLPLNPAESFGRLTVLDASSRPAIRDIVLCKNLPNEMPRVAGVISEVRQTPLSHVNLRAVQDKVPNAFIENASSRKDIAPLVGKFVYYRVALDGYEIREATAAEVEKHFAAVRPSKTQKPPRDLTIKTHRTLDEIRFEDSKAFGVKTANMSVLKRLRFPKDLVPSGYGLPFHFYDEFMKHNGFYAEARKMMATDSFKQDRLKRIEALENFRQKIVKGAVPQSMLHTLGEIQKQFPENQPIRCRSSTNNEDLPGFSGAGLYDSFTHRPGEGHLSNSVKEVFASLWNFRAFEEREFYRVDHLTTAMGVLMHRNFDDEKANGVAVTSDILYQYVGHHYLNTQVGEDLVTNPESDSVPEEVLVDWWTTRNHKLMRTSNRVKSDERILTDQHLDRLRRCLNSIHAEFAYLYKKDNNDKRFAMEIEYKITAEGNLVIKQARPWVFGPEKKK